MSNFYKDAMNIPIVGAEYGFNGVVDPEYARGHRDALVAASKIALDADAKIDGLETDLAEAQAEITRLWQLAYNGEYTKARNWGADHEQADTYALRVAGESSLEDIIRKAKEE